jgi:AraC-like DNA-binding protein
MKPMISAGSMIGLIETITAAGGNPEEVLATVGLDRHTASNSDGFIPCATFSMLLEAAARITGDNCFGLHFGERSNPKNVGPLIYVILNSPTIATSLENAGRYFKIHNEAAHLSFVIEGDRAVIRHALADLGVGPIRQHNELSMTAAFNTLRMMVGSQWVPQEVQFAHKAPDQISEHLRVFGVPVLFGYDTNAFVVEPEFIHRQIPAADPRLYRILKRYLDGIVSEMPREDGLLTSVRKTIAELMRHGDPKLPQVAKSLAVTPRTLQRRLREHDVDFKTLTDDTRRRSAIKYLKDPKNSLTEIAFLLGYSELSAFNRAFKRWTGSTPADFRRRKH